MPRRPLCLDTGPLVLLIVGLCQRDWIGRHKRTRDFAPEDFDLLIDLIENSEGLLLVPHVLAEASNHLDHIEEPRKGVLFEAFRTFLDTTDEMNVVTREGARRAEFVRLGVSDSVLLHAGAGGATILTSDLKLYLAAANAGMDAINFAHLQAARLGE